jgi:hypothetical protein
MTVPIQDITLRDYFAAQGMAALMPSVITELQKKTYSIEKAHLLKNQSAETCYAMADAMIEARKNDPA